MKLLDPVLRWGQPHLPAGPILDPIYPVATDTEVSAGWYYTEAEVAIVGRTVHNATDLTARSNTPVVAPISGIASASYGEVLILNQDGTRKMVTPEMVRRLHPKWPIDPPPNGELWGTFGSLMIQIIGEHGLFVQLGHLNWVSRAIPFLEGKRLSGGGGWRHSPRLRASRSQIVENEWGMPVKQGQLIGYSGMSGCGWGEFHYDRGIIHPDGRPDFRTVDYHSYDRPHTHVLVCLGRWPGSRKALLPVDSFGTYSGQLEDYPSHVSQFHAWPGSLWKRWV